MSAVPEDPNDLPWEDEWAADDWHELNLLDRGHYNTDGWRSWILRFLAIAVAVPVILGILVWLLILAL